MPSVVVKCCNEFWRGSGGLRVMHFSHLGIEGEKVGGLCGIKSSALDI